TGRCCQALQENGFLRDGVLQRQSCGDHTFYGTRPVSPQPGTCLQNTYYLKEKHMIYLGCHLTSAKGFENMAKEAISINADTLQFFTRNPRGGKAKAIDENDAARYRSLAAKHNFGKVVAH